MQTQIPQEILNAMAERKHFEVETANDTAKPVYHYSSPCGLLLDVG